MRRLCVLLAVIVCSDLVWCNVIDGIYYNRYSGENNVYVTYQKYQNPNSNYKYIAQTVTIPDSVDYGGIMCGVKAIGSYAFEYSSKLDTIYLPNTIKSIGDWSFWNAGIVYIEFGDSLESIGEKAFTEPCLVTELHFPASLTYIGANAFSYPYHLTDVYCAGSIPPALGYYVFYLIDMETQLHEINLHVPCGSADAYRSAGHWAYFNIMEDCDDMPTSVKKEQFAPKSLMVIENGQVIIIVNNKRYNVQGQLLR